MTLLKGCLWGVLICSQWAVAGPKGHKLKPASAPHVSRQISLAPPLLIPMQVTSGFGRRFHPVTARYAEHHGTDFQAPMFSKVASVQDGTVTQVAGDPISGRYLVITHKNGWVSKYLHLSSIKVHARQKVSKGDIIALSGASGRTTGPHLHFELSYNGKLINPATLLFSGKSDSPGFTVAPANETQPAAPAKIQPPPLPRIVLVSGKAGRMKIGVKKGNKLIFAQPGDKVFNNFRIVSRGKRYALEKILNAS